MTELVGVYFTFRGSHHEPKCNERCDGDRHYFDNRPLSVTGGEMTEEEQPLPPGVGDAEDIDEDKAEPVPEEDVVEGPEVKNDEVSDEAQEGDG